jgi:hypothetical protein
MMARWTRRVGIFTIILAVIAAFTAGIFWMQLETMKADQRPWVSAVIPLDKAPPGTDLTVHFDIKNAGKGPALAVCAKVTPSLTKDLAVTKEPGKCVAGDSHAFLLPGDTVPYGFIIPGAWTGLSVRTDDTRFLTVILIRIDYEDAEHSPHWTKLCWYYEVAAPGMSTCPGNSSAT